MSLELYIREHGIYTCGIILSIEGTADGKTPSAFLGEIDKMNKYELKRLALLGMTAGIFMTNPAEIEAMQEDSIIDLNYVLAKPKCKAHGGCGGLTASRDVNESATADDEDDDDDDDDEEEENDKEHEKDRRQPVKTPKAKASV